MDFFWCTGLDSLLAGIHVNFLCGDITIADRGINFGVKKAPQSPYSTIRWFDHNDLKGLEYVLLIVEPDVANAQTACETIHCHQGTFKKDCASVDFFKSVSYVRSETVRSPFEPLAFKHKSIRGTITRIPSFLARSCLQSLDTGIGSSWTRSYRTI